MKKHVTRNRILLILATLLVLVAIGFISPLRLVTYDIDSADLPEEFDGFRIVQITDFHCKEFGDNEEDLIKMVAKAKPDIICLTGDIIDEAHTTENARYLLEGISELAPVYYVTGNHEFYTGAPYDEFRSICVEYGITVLDSESRVIQRDDASILISGLDWQNSSAEMKTKLGYATPGFYNILLYHDSTKFDFISSFDYDLVLSGHIHGGIIRLPFIGGLLGSDYLLFPDYDYGIYNKKNSTMISSSGLGDARVPRWNNPREVVEITLHCE